MKKNVFGFVILTIAFLITFQKPANAAGPTTYDCVWSGSCTANQATGCTDPNCYIPSPYTACNGLPNNLCVVTWDQPCDCGIVPAPNQYTCIWDPSHIYPCQVYTANGCTDPNCSIGSNHCINNSILDYCIHSVYYCDCTSPPPPAGGGPIDWTNLQQIASPNFPVGTTIGSIITSSFIYIFAGAGLILTIFILYGGFTLMLSRGDPGSVAKGKSVLSMAIIGMVIVITAFWIVQFLGEFLNIQAIKDIF
jgi:hypothetical protein